MSASGERCARTTAPAATPGPTSVTTSRGRLRTAGARTASPASPTTSRSSASRSRSGTASDPILKERLFGLTNHEGNHGEDVKEYYFYLDSTPTHSYMRYLYKYPQAAFPYADLVETNRRPVARDLEYELIDTGVFDEDRYFDVFVEYAKAGPEDLLIEISALNRGPEAATLHLLPTLWFRNSWRQRRRRASDDPGRGRASRGLEATSAALGEYVLRCQRGAELLFVDNETNPERWRGDAEATAAGPSYFKDGINDYVVDGRRRRSTRGRSGTKAAAHYRVEIPARGSHRCACASPARRQQRRRRRGGAGDAFAGDRDAQARGGRVLCDGHPASLSEDRARRRAPVAGGNAVEQAVLRLRRGRLADRARHGAVAGANGGVTATPSGRTW